MKSNLLRTGDLREGDINNLIRYLRSLPTNRTYAWEVKEYRRSRTLEQNAYLWGVCYQTILEEGGEALRGWTKDDLHEFMLGECFGWETLEGLGRKRLRPLKRSSKLNTTEFADFIEFIQQKAAEFGIYVPEAA